MMKGLFLFLCMFILISGFSQITSSSINGVIKDKIGNTIENVKVELILKSKGIIRDTYTDRNGRFRFFLVDSGEPYTLRINKEGYRLYEKRNLEFILGDNDLNVIIEKDN